MFNLIMRNIMVNPTFGLDEERRFGLWQAICRNEAKGRLSSEEAETLRASLRFMQRVYNPGAWRTWG